MEAIDFNYAKYAGIAMRYNGNVLSIVMYYLVISIIVCNDMLCEQ